MSVDIRHMVCGSCHLYVTRVGHDGRSRGECEQAAVRRLIDEAFGSDANVAHTETGAPYIAGLDKHISISHSRDYACLAVSAKESVGVDVEQPREQLRRVVDRVLTGEEMAVYGASMDMMLRAWTLKEALYKAALTPGLDFRRDIHLPLDIADDTAYTAGKAFKIVVVDCQPERTISLVVRQA